jgi:hypothetical protein
MILVWYNCIYLCLFVGADFVDAPSISVGFVLCSEDVCPGMEVGKGGGVCEG